MADTFKFRSLIDHYFKEVMMKVDGNAKAGEAKAIFELHNLIQTLTDLEEPRYERMRIRLDEVTKAAKKLSGHALVKGKPPAKGVTGLVTKVAKIKSEVVKAEKAYEASGAAHGLVEVDISFRGTDFSNTPVNGAKLDLTIDSYPKPVKLSQTLSNGNFRFRGILVEPDGNAHATLTLPRSVSKKMSANASYKGLTKGKTLSITASEDKVEKTVSETSGKRAAASIGAKGTVGVDFKVYNGSAEISSTSELEKSYSKQVTYKVTYPKGKLTLKQD